MSKAMLRIGVSGHQQIGDEATIEFVSQQLRELLATFQRQAQERSQDILVYSALALGTDQLFVKIALEMGIPVELVIPCSQYEEIFSTTEARDEYHRLLSLCQDVHRLPFDDCSEDAYLAAGHWIVDHSDLVILIWNGYPAGGRGGTADIANFARFMRCPFIHIHTRLRIVQQYGSLFDTSRTPRMSAKRAFAVEKQTIYQGGILRVDHYRLQMPDGRVIERDIVERPESVLVLPVGQKNNLLLIEEYDLAADTW